MTGAANGAGRAGADLTQRVAVVTGASSGIGAAVARELAGRGARLLLVGRDAQRLRRVASEIPGAADRVRWISADVSSPDGPRNIVERAVAEFGALNTLVHAAGIFEPATLSDVTIGSLNRQWMTNVCGPVMLTQHALAHLRDGGRVVFFASIFGRSGYPGSVAYAASKGALDSVTLALAAELAPEGIRVNAVAPGCVTTGMNADMREDQELHDALAAGALMNRWATPEEIAPAVAFMVSDEASFVHGTTLVVDGGWLAR
jgi:NAD(P)-dependent dehydrogenase (short-subunit alcohol dehydrogenase family)